MKSINKVSLIGNIGGFPELQQIDENIKVVKLQLATSDTYKDKFGNKQKETQWHNLVFWNSLADIANNFITKGSYVYIDGKLKTREYLNKDGYKMHITEIIVEQVLMLDKKNIEPYTE